MESSRTRPRLFSHRNFPGYVSLGLGGLAFISVLCFHFPQLLTSVETRAIYSEQFARTLLLIGLVAAFVLGTLAVLTNRAQRSRLIDVVPLMPL